MTGGRSDSDAVAAGAYADSLDHVRDELGRLDLVLRRHLETWWAANGGVVDEFRGLYVADETVERLFPDDPATSGTATDDDPGDRELRAALAARSAAIAVRKRRTLAAGTELRLARLADLFDLSPGEVDALLLALAPALDRRYETLYSYLHDDVTAKLPTVGLLCAVLTTVEGDATTVRRRFARGRPLRSHRLVRIRDHADAPLRARAVTVDERIADYLLGGDDVDPELDGVAELVGTDADAPGPDEADLAGRLGLDDASRRALDRLLAAAGDEAVRRAAGGDGAATRAPLAYVWGPPGSGRRAVAVAAGHARGRGVVETDATRLRDGPLGVGETFDRLRREASLRDAVLSIRECDAFEGDERDRVVAEADRFAGPVVLAGATAWRPRTPPATHVFVSVPLPAPATEARRRLWRSALVGTGVEEGEVDGLASKFRLTPGAIRDAVETARQATAGEGVEVDALHAACRRRAGASLARLARSVPQPYTWDDLVLPEDQTAHLREVAAHVTHRGTVYDDWGFADRYATGNGLVVLFSGPSGTGKTMAASIVAREAGLDLYRIDLSSVVSKYIGETEKNLSRIFEAANEADVVLLFDEADALFGKRSEVSDAHDRYANIEVNYLLQRVEAYDGVVVLTTNFRRNIDDAFTRRIHLSVEFPRPDRTAREAIWRGVFPDETPTESLDVEFLSTLELTGGNIKNAALTAAFLAADAGEPVRMPHVVRAVKRELQKAGTLVSPDAFGDYWDRRE